MKDLNKIELAIGLIRIGNGDISDEELVDKIKEEFKIDCTLEDIYIIYASNYTDNFEIQSKSLMFYGEYIY